MLLLSLCILLLSPYHPVAWSNLGSPFWLCNIVTQSSLSLEWGPNQLDTRMLRHVLLCVCRLAVHVKAVLPPLTFCALVLGIGRRHKLWALHLPMVPLQVMRKASLESYAD